MKKTDSMNQQLTGSRQHIENYQVIIIVVIIREKKGINKLLIGRLKPADLPAAGSCPLSPGHDPARF